MRYTIIIVNFLIVLLSSEHSIFAQKQYLFSQYEDTLQNIAKDILYGANDFIKYNANDKFMSTLQNALKNDRSFDYPFDSLISIARLRSPDNSFRIFNWNLPKSDGTYEYFGIIQTHKLGNERYDIYVLTDRSDEIKDPENQILSYDNWYGAHYYKLIKNTSGKKEHYTLLGWDGNNSASTKKIIEVLSFRSNGEPVFGAYIFKRYKKKTYRIIFEYSSSVMVSLKYEDQSFYVQKKSSSHKKKIRKVSERMIVFDRLMPMDPELEGQYQFYVPETNIFDGFVFHNGKWIFIKEVDARNPEKKSNKKDIKKPEFDLFPPKPDKSDNNKGGSKLQHR